MKIEEQEKVLNVKNKNLIVSASAGSGKTHVMIEKIMGLLTSKDPDLFCSTENLLVLTYTNETAVELQNKIATSIKEKAPENDILKGQLDGLSLGHIGTFHSFCEKLIKKYGFVLNDYSAFSLASEMETKSLMQKAAEQVINDEKKGNRKQLSLLFDYVANPFSFASLQDLLIRFYGFLSNLKDSNDYIKNTLFKLCDYQVVLDLTLKILRDELSFVLEEEKKMLEDFKHFGDAKLNEYIVQFIAESEQLLSFSEDGISKYLMVIPRKKPLRGVSEIDEIEKEKLAEMASAHSNILGKFKDIFSNFSREHAEKLLQQQKECLTELLRLEKAFEEKYSTIKESEKVLDFSDLEKIALKLLENEEIEKQVKASYKYIFVDEFQDANYVQMAILDKVRRKNNLFLVGDLKQGIYQFRQSCPEIFIEMQKIFSSEPESEELKLKCNFRTKKEILAFVDEIFKVIFTENDFKINYAKDSCFVPLKEFKDVDGEIPIEFLCLQKDAKKTHAIYPLDEGYDIKKHANLIKNEQSNSSIETLSNATAQKIAELLKQDIYDEKAGITRKIKYSDIAILVRRRTHTQTLKRALNDALIPTSCDSGESLSSRKVTRGIFGLVMSTVFPQKDIYTAIALKYVEDISDGELFEIFQAEGECLSEKCQNFSSNENISKKIKNLLALQNKYVRNYMLDIAAGISKFEEENNFVSKFILQEDDSKNAYATLLSYAEAQGTLTSFAEFLQDNFESLAILPQKESENAVSIITMHASKGLEWGVVVLFDMGASLNSPASASPKLSLNRGLGASLKSEEGEKLATFLTNHAANFTDRAESFRLLYVALTRAKNKLIIVGETNINGLPSKNCPLLKRTDYLSSILSCLDKKTITALQNMNAEGSLRISRDVKFSFISHEMETENETEKMADFKDAINHIDAALCNQKPLQMQQGALQKTTVTSILNKTNEQDLTEHKFANESSLLEQGEHDDEIYAQNTEQKISTGIYLHELLKNFDYSKTGDLLRLAGDEMHKFNIETKHLENLENTLKSLIDFSTGKILRESPFLMKEENGQIIQGIVDFAQIKEDEIIIIDYKYSTKNIEKLKECYKTQLLLYKQGLEKSFKKPCKKLYILNINKLEYINII